MAGGGAGVQQTLEPVRVEGQPPEGDGGAMGGAVDFGPVAKAMDYGVEVKLDLWHAMDRVLRPAHKTHGARGSFAVDLRDTMAIPDPVALSNVRAMVKKLHPTWSGWEIERELRRKYSKLVLPHVPRLIPDPRTLIKRFDSLVGTYKDIPDASTGEIVSTAQLTVPCLPLLPFIPRPCVGVAVCIGFAIVTKFTAKKFNATVFCCRGSPALVRNFLPWLCNLFGLYNTACKYK